MVSYCNALGRSCIHSLVLILIVVDDGLVLSMRQLLHFINEVLILVVVEDGLVQFCLEYSGAVR